MRNRKPRIASLDEVIISRIGDEAFIEHADSNVAPTCLPLGPEVQAMSDQEILDIYNRSIEETQHYVADYENVVLEIPAGRPQLEYDVRQCQWTPRGQVLRCAIEQSTAHGGTIIRIDDQELSTEEFGRLLGMFSGWGMRISFVPEDLVCEHPDVELYDPDEKMCH